MEDVAHHWFSFLASKQALQRAIHALEKRRYLADPTGVAGQTPDVRRFAPEAALRWIRASEHEALLPKRGVRTRTRGAFTRTRGAFTRTRGVFTRTRSVSTRTRDVAAASCMTPIPAGSAMKREYRALALAGL